MAEHEEQVAIFEWAAVAANRDPELRLLFAVPNAGKRSYKLANYMRMEGLKKGVPDMVLPVPRGAWHGLFIELKWGKGKLSEDQGWWRDALAEQEYAVHTCYGALAAIEVIKGYLSLRPFVRLAVK